MEQPEEPDKEPRSAFPIINSVVAIIGNPDNVEFKCIFCKRSTVDELNLGPLYHLPEPEHNVVAHYFCMLFSAGIVQQGDDKQGILGFLPDDIFKEARRAQRLKCSYCQVNGASIGCNTSRCKISFHFPCGLANDANFQFKNYQAFCKSHSTLPEITLPLAERKCNICWDEVEPPERPIIGQCCKTSVFHKLCLQRLALNAGYFYNCPTCRSSENFPDNTKFQGIFVPEQDASWEMEPNAYEDLYQSYNRCDSTKCECPKGREYGANKGSWLLAICRLCGSAGTHRLCGKLSTIANWACSECLEVEARTTKHTKKSANLVEPEPGTTETAHIHGCERNISNSNLGKQLKVKTGRKPKGALAKSTAKESISPDVFEIGTGKHKVVSTNNEDRSELQAPSKVKRLKGASLPEDIDVDQDDEYVDLSQIQIHLSSRDYFPLSKGAKKKFASQGVFPDWQNYRLQVQMVDIFLDTTDATETPIRLTSHEKRKVVKPNTNDNAVQFLGKPKQNEKLNTATKVQTVSRGRSRRRNKRTSNWSKGWAKRKKKPASSKPPDVTPTCSDKDNVDNLKHQLAGTTSPDSQAVLVGIRRSQESLLQLKAQSSGRSDQETPTSVDDTSEKHEDGHNVKVGKTNSLKSRRPSETAMFSEDNNMNGAADSDQNERYERNPRETSGSPKKHAAGNGISSSTSSNEMSGAISCSREDGYQLVNGVTPRISQTARSDKNTTEVVKNNTASGKDSSNAGSTNERLILELHQGAQDIARHLLSLQDQNEANAHLRVLEENCPQLFKGNLPMKFQNSKLKSHCSKK